VRNAFKNVKTFFGGWVKVEIAGIKNPKDNKHVGSFTIKTFVDDKQVYVMDTLRDKLMFPGL